MKHSLLLLLAFAFCFSSAAQKTQQSPWQQQVSYHIDASLDDVGHYLDAKLLLEYTNNSPNTLDFVVFHLWPNAYKNTTTAFAKQHLGNGKTDFQYSSEEERGWISGLDFTSEGIKLMWSFDAAHIDIAKVQLTKPLQPGETVTIETPFRVKIPKVFSRLGHEGQDYFMTQWYPKPAVYDVNGWNAMPYLNQGEFYSEFGTFSVNLTLPANYVTAATGELQTISEKEFLAKRKDYPLKIPKDSVPASASTTKVVTYTANKVHDFAWFASKKFNLLESSVEVEGEEILTQVFSYSPKKIHLDYIAHAVTFYSDEVGAYPYSHATVVHGELKAGGGMEYPMITLCDVMAEEVIIHEVGHNWFYGILGSNERVYPWMDESINSFYDSKATAADKDNFINKGMQARIMAFLTKNNVVNNAHQSVDMHSADYTSLNYGVSVYNEGSRAFAHLHAYLGDAKFKAAMRNYFKEFAFKHPLPGDMKASFEASTGQDLAWFFNGVLSSADGVDHKLYTKKGKVWLKNNSSFTVPMPLVFSNESRSQTVWVAAPAGESTVVDAPFEGYTSVVIDPNGVTSDYSTNNDRAKTKFKFGLFTGQDSKGVIEMYAMPAIGWNMYDKFQLGLSVHNYGMTVKPFQYYITPLYSFSNKKINGLAQLNLTTSLPGLGSKIDWKLNAQKFSWAQSYNPEYAYYQEYDYLKIQPEIVLTLPKSSLRSKMSQEISLKYNRIQFDPSFDVEAFRQGSQNPAYQTLSPWQFFVAGYKMENKRAINGYAFQLEIEHGATSKSIHTGLKDTLFEGGDTSVVFLPLAIRQTHSTHTKVTASLDLHLDIGIKDKPMHIRAFASYFIKAPEDGYFKHAIGYTGQEAFRADYRMDELMMFRSGNEGMLRNQIAMNGSRSRFVGQLGQSDKLMANVLITVPLPGKLPIKPYVEFMTFTDIDEVFWNDSKASMMYNIGVELQVIPNVFSIYFNLAQNKDVSLQQENVGIDKFMERVTFTLNLNRASEANVTDLINF